MLVQEDIIDLLYQLAVLSSVFQPKGLGKIRWRGCEKVMGTFSDLSLSVLLNIEWPNIGLCVVEQPVDTSSRV